MAHYVCPRCNRSYKVKGGTEGERCLSCNTLLVPAKAAPKRELRTWRGGAPGLGKRR